MTIALGLMGAAVLVGLLGPAYLRGAVSPRVRPGPALTGWIASVLAVALSAVASAALLSMPHNASVDSLIGMAATCINTGQRVWETALRLSGTAAVLAAVARVLFVAIRTSRRENAKRHRHLSLLRFVGRTEPADSSLFWLHEDTPVAYSIGGREGVIVATTGVARLDPAAQEAILAHERAHLRGWHHRLVLLVEVLARALPFVPLFRAAPPAVRVLVELAADATAARTHGPGRVQAALRAVSAGTVPGESLAMSRDAVQFRIRWLDPAHATSPSGLRRRVDYTAAALTSIAPAVLSTGLTAGLVLLWCLGLSTPL